MQSRFKSQQPVFTRIAYKSLPFVTICFNQNFNFSLILISEVNPTAESLQLVYELDEFI